MVSLCRRRHNLANIIANSRCGRDVAARHTLENRPTGLTSDEARRRLSQFGHNATPDVAVHPLRLVLSKFLAPVSVLLEIAIALQFALGEYVEASIIGALLVFLSLIHI